jgi:nucleoside-diphosphate-sugar epimerase
MKAGAPVKEDWPLEPSADRRGAYTRTKLEAEQLVRRAVEQHRLPAVILRPGLVFGPGGPILTPSVALRRGKRLLVFGNGRQELPLVYVDDLIDAIVAAPERPVFDGSVFHLVDPEIVTQDGLIRDYLAATKQRLHVWHLPRLLLYGAALGIQCLAKLLRRTAPLSVYRLRSAMTTGRFDCTQARERLGWQPRVGVREGLRRTLAALEAEKGS